MTNLEFYQKWTAIGSALMIFSGALFLLGLYLFISSTQIYYERKIDGTGVGESDSKSNDVGYVSFEYDSDLHKFVQVFTIENDAYFNHDGYTIFYSSKQK